MQEQMTETKGGWTGAIVAAVLGVAAGAAVGLLFAPKKGSETRKDVNNWLKYKRFQTQEYLANSKVKEVVGAQTERLGELMKKGREVLASKFNHVKEKELVA